MTVQTPHSTPPPLVDRRRRPRTGLFQHFKTVALRLWWHSDAVTVRLVLAASSFGWAIGAWTQPRTAVHAIVSAVTGGYVTPAVSGALFMLHFVGVVWRAADPRTRMGWGLVVNTYGLALWFGVTLVTATALGGVTSGTSADWALCLFAAWALFRTGAPDAVTP